MDKGPNSGKVFSEETRQRMSAAKKGKYVGANSPRAKAVLQLDVNTMRIIKEWPTAVEASETLGILRSSISGAAKGRLPTAGGFRWMFAEDNQNDNDVGTEASILGHLPPPRVI